MLIPLLCVLLWLHDPDKIAATTRTVCFGLFCMPFPLAWMHGNEAALGDALYPIHYIEKFHHAWVAAGIARWGNVGYRLQNLGFWPGAALVTLSPGVALLGFVGMVRAWKDTRHRWLLWVFVVPTVYFALRSAVLMNFVPLARFTFNQLVLVLPYVALGFHTLVGKRSLPVRSLTTAGVVLMALALPASLAWVTYQKEGGLSTSMRPVSPLSTNPPAVMQVANFMRTDVAPKGGGAIFDADPGYWDMQMVFYSGLAEDHLARYRWNAFPEPTGDDHPDWVAKIQAVSPKYLVVVDEGAVEKSTEFRRSADAIFFRDERYHELKGFQRPYHVFQRD